MDKYVSRDDVRRFIADAFSENRFATNYDYAILVDKIDELPAADVQPAKQWVRLHDKHPDTEGFYLVCDQYGECEVVKYIRDIKSWFTHKINGEIRYWMPLPKPPKDGDTNE